VGEDRTAVPAPRKPHNDLLREALAAAPQDWLDFYLQRRIRRAFPE
jgi:hypothetical protein